MVRSWCVIVLAVLASSPAALAAPRARLVRAHFSGALTLSWQGDPARGCADAGLCGYAGSVTVQPPEEADFRFAGGRPEGGGSFGGFDQSPVVRVVRDGGAGTCVDSIDTELFEFDLTARGASRVGVALSPFASPLSAGRCAGPAADELASAVPVPTFDLRAITRRATVLRWPDGSFAAGPFSGHVASSLTAHLDRVRLEPRPRAAIERPRIPARLRGRRVWATSGDWTYRVASLGGELDAAFQGGGDCALVDSCGLTGLTALRLTARPQNLEVSTERSALTPPRRTRSGALDRAALSFFGDAEFTTPAASVTETVARPGATPCRDQRVVEAPGIDAQRVGGRLVLSLGQAQELGYEVVRTHCPGPGQADVYGAGSLVTGSLPLTDLGRRRLTVTLTRPGAFTSFGYAGTRGGALTVALDLVRARSLRTVSRRIP